MSHSEMHSPSASGHAAWHSRHPYLSLALTFPIHVAIMYVLMFAMIDTAADFWNNTNMFYMALLMAAPMTAIMPVTMPGMYPDKGVTAAVIGLFLLVGLLSFLAIRGQWGIGDRQFLRSMIPHHSGAILMCQQSTLTDPRILDLCDGIVASQRAEIDQMRALLAE